MFQSLWNSLGMTAQSASTDDVEALVSSFADADEAQAGSSDRPAPSPSPVAPSDSRRSELVAMPGATASGHWVRPTEIAPAFWRTVEENEFFALLATRSGTLTSAVGLAVGGMLSTFNRFTSSLAGDAAAAGVDAPPPLPSDAVSLDNEQPPPSSSSTTLLSSGSQSVVSSSQASVQQTVVGDSYVQMRPAATYPYRIVLRCEPVAKVIAVSDSEEDIWLRWTWIEQHLLTNKSLSHAAEDRAAMLDWLTLKFESMAILSAEEAQARQQRLFQKAFNLAADEPLVAYFLCSLWDKPPRIGWLYLSTNYVCFESKYLARRMVINFAECETIRKEQTAYIAVKLWSRQQVYFSAFWDRDDAFAKLFQLWQLHLERRFVAAEAANAARSHYNEHLRREKSRARILAYSQDSQLSSSPSRQSQSQFQFQSQSPSQSQSQFQSQSPSQSQSQSPSQFQSQSPSPSPSPSPSQSTQSIQSTQIDQSTDLQSESNQSQQNKGRSGGSSTGRSSASLLSTAAAVAAERNINNSTQDPSTQAILFRTPSKDLLKQCQLDDECRFIFRLPAHQSMLHHLAASLALSPDAALVPGQLYLSQHFLSWVADVHTPLSEQGLLVVPLRSVLSIEWNEDRTIDINVLARHHYLRLHITRADPGNKSFVNNLLGFWKVRLSVLAADMNAIQQQHIDTIVDEHSAGGRQRQFVDVPGIAELLDDRGSFSDDYETQQLGLIEQWAGYFAANGKLPMCLRPSLHPLIRAGIPDSFRGLLWYTLSGGYHCEYGEEPNYYADLHSKYRDHVTESIEDIEKDLLRSWPQHPFFREGKDGIARLRRVLAAYSWRNPALGYCQALNIITAVLLVFMPEEQAFWTLCAICEILAPGNYTKQMLGTIINQSVFEVLLKDHQPYLHAHLVTAGLPIAAFTQPWFLTLFIGYIPLETALRTLDLFFFEGTKALYAMALSLFVVKKNQLVEETEASNFSLILRQHLDDFPHCHQRLLDNCFRYLDYVSDDKIQEIQQHCRSQIIRDIEQRNKLAQLRELDDLLAAADSQPRLRDVVESAYDQFTAALCKIPVVVTSSPAASSTTDVVSAGMDRRRFVDFLFPSLLPAWQQRPELAAYCFAAVHSRLDSPVVSFAEVLRFLLPALLPSNDNIAQVCRLCFLIHDHDHDGALDRGDLYRMLDAILRLYHISFDEHSIASLHQEMLMLVEAVVVAASSPSLPSESSDVIVIGASRPDSAHVRMADITATWLDSPLLRDFINRRQAPPDPDFVMM